MASLRQRLVWMFGVTHIGDEEDETAGEENGSACHGKRQKEASRVVHEGSDHRPDCEAKVERGVAPGLHNVVWLGRGWKFTLMVAFSVSGTFDSQLFGKFTLTVAFLSGNLAIKMERLEVHVAAAPTPFETVLYTFGGETSFFG